MNSFSVANSDIKSVSSAIRWRMLCKGDFNEKNNKCWLYLKETVRFTTKHVFVTMIKCDIRERKKNVHGNIYKTPFRCVSSAFHEKWKYICNVFSWIKTHNFCFYIAAIFFKLHSSKCLAPDVYQNLWMWQIRVCSWL